jgi:multiple sugar transport system permease protein
MRNPLRRKGPLDLSPVSKLVTYGLMLAWSFIALFPLYWLAITSFKTPIQVDKGPFFIPFVDFQPTLSAWEEIVVKQANDTLRPYGNTILVGVVSAVVTLVIAAFAAYALTRFRYEPRLGIIGLFIFTVLGAGVVIAFGVPWQVAVAGGLGVFLLLAQTIGRRFRRSLKNDDISMWMIAQRILPPIAVAIPVFVLYQQIGLLDTPAGLVAAYVATNLPIAIWLLRDFFAALPIELEEAASVDGASVYRIVRSVVLPIAMPGLVATFLITLIFAWNEFLVALMLSGAKMRTMPLLVAAQDATRGPQWWAMSVLILLMIGPVIIMAIVLERYISKGVLVGAVKG